VMYRDGLYLLAKTAGAVDQTRPYIYAVERIETAAVARDVVFEVPADFDPQKLFEGRLGIWSSDEPPLPIRLAFAGRAARYARERRWPGQAHWTEEDGRSILELKVPVTPEVVSWIIGWGPDLEVLSPLSLRTQVRERHMAAVARYGAE
jgi:predicted DNA-binding transcriptional regulator YafY